MRPEGSLPRANHKSLLQEQDLASDYPLFSQVCPGFPPQALCCSSGSILPLPHFISCTGGLSHVPVQTS